MGLLAGDPSQPAQRIMTCLTITPESAEEAIAQNANMIVSHHPLPFRPLKRITTDTVGSRLLWNLIRAGISIYSPHTGFDSATEGINQSLSKRIGIADPQPLVPILNDPQCLGAGRFGSIDSEQTLEQFVSSVKTNFGLDGIHIVGELANQVKQIAVACGSGGSFLEKARRAKCDTFVTGENDISYLP